MRCKALAATLIVGAYIAGVLTADFLPRLQAQQQSSRFVSLGTDGPFRVWQDTRTDRCFIVTTPYFAMMSVGPC